MKKEKSTKNQTWKPITVTIHPMSQISQLPPCLYGKLKHLGSVCMVLYILYLNNTGIKKRFFHGKQSYEYLNFGQYLVYPRKILLKIVDKFKDQ